MIDADSSKEAKTKRCRQLHRKQSDPWTGASPMTARKVTVDYPDAHYRPGYNEDLFEQLEGKDIIIYDEFHGVSTRIRKATSTAIGHFVDEYSTIIVL